MIAISDTKGDGLARTETAERKERKKRKERIDKGCQKTKRNEMRHFIDNISRKDGQTKPNKSKDK